MFANKSGLGIDLYGTFFTISNVSVSNFKSV